MRSNTDAIQLIGTPSRQSDVRCVRDGTTWILEEMVIRPIDLTLSHGYDFTVERLQECARAYDPTGIYQAQLNLDHLTWGPSYGPVLSLEMRGEELWMIATVLDGVLASEINSGKWPYRSGDWRIQHPATGGLYLIGCALLGAAEPAVWGQRQSVTSEGQISLSAKPYQILLGRPAGHRETPMNPTDTVPATPAAPVTAVAPTPATQVAVADATPATVTPAAPAPIATAVPVAPAAPAAPNPTEAAATAAASQVAVLQTQIAVLQRRTAMADGELRLTSDLTRLQAQVTPAVLRTEGFREFLLELAAYPQTYTIHLAAAGTQPAREVSSYSVLMTALSRLPRFAALGAPEMANEPVELSTDHRSPDQIEIDRRHGITDDQAAKLRRTSAAYPARPN